MTDEQKPPVEGDGAPGDGNGAEAPPPAPPPSTYAGRSRQGDPPEPQPSGVTDELELLEQEISAEAADGLADLPKPEPAVEPDPESGAKPPVRGETVESDTIVLSDREAAQEAALEGVRARAAAHTTKKPVFPGPGAAAAAPPAGAGAAAPPAVALPAKGLGGPSDLPPRPVSPEVGKAPKGRLWLRFLVGSILIVVSMATATAVSGLVLASKLADGLRGLKSVQTQLTAADPSNPQTILILGSDRRPGETDRGRSDTTILLRVSSDHINLLSIPRDLKVPIPGYGTDKFNAAYTYGGPKLTTETVKQLTGLPINVVVNINFTGFADAVNEIGCVYIDVDHHYYHSNVGLSTVDQYSAINIPSGYQRMCGFNALSYVRYRHDDNDLVRSARQQAFLREARAQVPASKFLNDYNGLINIFTKYTTSTIQGTSQLIGLANLFFSARNAQIKEIHFPGDIGTATSTYVTATHAAVKQTVAEFLGTTAPT
ncbi:MAG: polyisoprenyl-teichoic acid--peptidoglycan teichoic acid transferase, partial [Solirubrobacterales bacterium]|nr:polyisoprenyl-teichoic acid--peptidoglycan teichoic acid transferase [Solirubrobacterales bacterium]